MRLIHDWKIAWRFLSVQAAVLLALLSGLQAEVLPIVSPLFPPDWWPWISGGLALLIVVLRLWAQPSLEIERIQLELNALDGPHVPPGLLEQYLGALVVILVLLMVGVAWLIWSTL